MKENLVVACLRPPSSDIYVVVVHSSDGKEMYKKSVKHLQSCCFSHALNLSLFSPSRCRHRRRRRILYPFKNIFTDNNLLNIFLRVANGHMSNSFFFLQLAMRTKKHKKGFGHRVSRNTSKHKHILITVQY